MKLATWNINSIRAREERLLTWLGQERPDVLCLQETKVEDSGFPLAPLKKLGYEVAIFGPPARSRRSTQRTGRGRDLRPA